MASVPVSPQSTSPQPGIWDHERRRLTLGLVLTVTLVAFEALAISTVMPVVADDLGGLSLYGWVFSGFFLGNLLGIVFAGHAADREGTALPFLAGLLLFGAGLLVAGLAPSMGVLVVARVLQGIGAGVIATISYITVGRSYPPILRPRAFAVTATAWLIPGLIGPVASIAIADVWGWRAVFLALLPFILLAGFITLPALVHSPGADRAATVGPLTDRRRAGVLLTLGSAMVLGSISGPSPPVAVVLALVGVPLAAWSFLSLVPTGTMRLAAGIPAAIAVRGILTFSFFGTDAYVSLSFQDVRDQPTWVAGLSLTICTLCWSVAVWVQERWILRVGPRRVVGVGFALLSISIALMFTVLGSLPIPLAVCVWGIGGFAIGLCYASLSVTVLGLAEPGREGAATASLQVSDVLGIALGVGVAGAFVALGETRSWSTGGALQWAFACTLAMAVVGIAASRRLPTTLPT
ncbi:MAG: MFS transporter [Acidimicrobiia bacterium]|nr:MFS transporter [Acidimicrobiia bacterium]